MNFLITTNCVYLDCTDGQAEKLSAVYVKSKQMYKVPLTLGALREIYTICPDPKIIEAGKKLKKRYDYLKSIKQLEDVYGDDNLRPYQRVDIAFLEQIPHKGIFNQQRTGKTPTTLKLIESEEYKSVIIVCPSSLKMNWFDEVKKWTKYTPIIVDGTPKKREQLYQEFQKSVGCTLIISYETLRNDYEQLSKPFDCLLLDEAHRIRNVKTQQTKAINKLGKFANCRMAATGTPAVNHAVDIYGILHFLYPKEFSSYWQFVDRYFEVNESFFGKEVGKPKREAELTEILEMISTNRKRKDIMTWLPDVEHQTIRLEADKVQLKEYQEMLKTFEIERDGEIITEASNPLTQLMRLRQINLDPSLLNLKGKSAKEKFVLDYIADNPDEPIIIFSTFTSYLRTLAQKIKNPALIFGEHTSQAKQNNVRKFQEGKTNILLANIQSGGVGFTIDRAETIIYLDKSFNLIDNEQSADRFIPTKEQANLKKRTIIDLVIADTIDEKINQMLVEKKNIVEIVNTYGIEVLK